MCLTIPTGRRNIKVSARDTATNHATNHVLCALPNTTATTGDKHTHIKRGYIKMLNHTLTATLIDGTTLKGHVIDITASNKYVWIQNEVDFYCIDLANETTSWTVSDEVTLCEQPIEEEEKPYHNRFMDARELNKALKPVLNGVRNEVNEFYVAVFKYEDEYTNEVLHDVEATCFYTQWGTTEEMASFTTDTYADEKQAVKRAKQLAKKLGVEFKEVYTV